MGGQDLPVPRLEGVSKEQFMEHLYPQVRPSGRAEPREARGYPSRPLGLLRTCFLLLSVWGEGGVLRWLASSATKGEAHGDVSCLIRYIFRREQLHALGSRVTGES